jgi:hypothetical protein
MRGPPRLDRPGKFRATCHHAAGISGKTAVEFAPDSRVGCDVPREGCLAERGQDDRNCQKGGCRNRLVSGHRRVIPGRRMVPVSASTPVINIPETTSLSRREQSHVDRHSSCDDEIEKGVASQNLTVQPDFDCHVEYRRTRAERRRWRQAGSKARLRRAGPGDLIGAMVAGSRRAAPAEPGFCRASDRNRRAGPANTALVPGNGRRCAERLPSAPTPGSGCRHQDAANHLITMVVIRAYQD